MVSQERKRGHKPATVFRLYDLTEIRALWGVGHERVYNATARGELHAYGRPGRQKYYLEAELTQVFGTPNRPDSPNTSEDALTRPYLRAA